MPIQFLIEHDRSFGPDEIAKLVEAFERALGELGLVRRDDPATVLVAKAIMDAAKSGELDPKRLRDLAVGELTAQAAPPIAPDERSTSEQPLTAPERTAGPSATTAASVAERRRLRTRDGLNVPTALACCWLDRGGVREPIADADERSGRPGHTDNDDRDARGWRARR